MKLFPYTVHHNVHFVMIVHVHTIYMYTTSSVITQYGRSALIWAASEGHTEAVVELVKAGANLDLQDNVCHC